MKIHILGICGVMTTPLAIALREQGTFDSPDPSHQDKIYPPFSTELKKHHITVNQPVNFFIYRPFYRRFLFQSF